MGLSEMKLNRLFCATMVAVAAVPSMVSAGTVTISSGTGRLAPRQPQSAVSSDGTVHVVYGAGDTVYYSRSTDGGATFSAPEKAFDCPNLYLGMRRGPRIATAKNSVVVTAIGGEAGKGKDGDLMAWSRNDMGQWSGPFRVNDVDESAREGLHAMASSPSGVLWCSWLDLRTKGMKVYASRSTDGGKTWSPNVPVYQSPDGSVCECCHPSIVVGVDERPHVLFRNQLDGNRDMYVISGNAQGDFTGAKLHGDANWALNRCPMDGGMLAVDSAGRVATAWRREEEVFVTTGGSEQKLGPGKQPWMTFLGEKPLVLWVEKNDGKLLSWRGAGPSTVLADVARDPVVVSSGDGKKAFACWESVTGDDRAIVGMVIE
jgi:hypothetical protein